jgi:hypothetical protein
MGACATGNSRSQAKFTYSGTDVCLIGTGLRLFLVVVLIFNGRDGVKQTRAFVLLDLYETIPCTL